MKAIVALVALLAVGQAPVDTGPAQVTQRQFKRMLAARQIVVIDVRTRSEFDDGHIAGAMSISFASILWAPEYDQIVETLKKGKKPFVVYCACKGDSQAIRGANALMAHGLTDVRVLTGGWNVWFNDGNRITKGPK